MMATVWVDPKGNISTKPNNPTTRVIGVALGSDNDCPVKSCGHLTMEACVCKAMKYWENHPGWQWKKCGHLNSTICQCADQPAGEKKEMAEVLTPARQAIKDYQDKSKEFLLRNGWKFCFDSDNNTERWANIFSADYTGRCYVVPIMRYADDIHEAMVMHSVWEQHGYKFDEAIKRNRLGLNS